MVIGDVHGCIEELEELLALAPEREVVFVGDLVAKGPNSLAVVRRARSLGARAVCGNHDAHFLAHHRRDERMAARFSLSAYDCAQAEQLSPDDWAYLESLPRFLRLPAHGAILVHAGLRPGVAPEEHDPSELMTMRSVRPDGSSSKRIEDGEPWAALWPGPETILFGHDAVRGLQQYPYAIGLDTGCVYGRSLTGLLLPERELISVPARRVWSPPRGRPS